MNNVTQIEKIELDMASGIIVREVINRNDFKTVVKLADTNCFNIDIIKETEDLISIISYPLNQDEKN